MCALILMYCFGLLSRQMNGYAVERLFSVVNLGAIQLNAASSLIRLPEIAQKPEAVLENYVEMQLQI